MRSMYIALFLLVVSFSVLLMVSCNSKDPIQYEPDLSIIFLADNTLNIENETEFNSRLEEISSFLSQDPNTWQRTVSDIRAVLIHKSAIADEVTITKISRLLKILDDYEVVYSSKRLDLVEEESGLLIKSIESSPDLATENSRKVIEILSDSMYELGSLTDYYLFSLSTIENILKLLFPDDFDLLQYYIQDFYEKLLSNASFTIAHYDRETMNRIRSSIEQFSDSVLKYHTTKAKEALSQIIEQIDWLMNDENSQDISLDSLASQASNLMTSIKSLPGEPLLGSAETQMIEEKLIELQNYLNERISSEQRSKRAQINKEATDNIKNALDNKGKEYTVPASFLAKVDRDAISPEVDQYYWAVFNEIAKTLDTGKMQLFVTQILEGRGDL